MTVTDIETSWQQQIRESFRSSSELAQFLGMPVDETSSYTLFIPRSMAKIIKKQGVQGPLYRQFVAQSVELDSLVQSTGLADPIGDKIKSQGAGIIHRYANRILFTPTIVCPINCRYCFRKNELASESFFKSNLEQLTSYLQSHEEVNEVILTGGDPLMLSDQKLRQCFEVIASSPKVKFLRIHTRFPVVIPERITEEFKSLITDFAGKIKIVMALHTNHASEITESVEQALTQLQKVPITLLSQTVLLKGVNDSSESLIQLFTQLDELNVRPYYLHHPDKVLGAMHFCISLEEGRKIYAALRDRLPGWILPHYVIDGPQGRGKTLAFNPETFHFSGNLIDKDGAIYSV